MATDITVQHHVCAYLDEHASTLHFVLANRGQILHANRYAKDTTGRALVGEQFQDIVVDFDDTFDLDVASRDPLTERLISIETPPAPPQSYLFSFRRVGDQIAVFGRLDTQELDQMRSEVLSLNQELSNLTRELHQKNAHLGRLNEQKNRFLGMAAHDLRKPIGLIGAYSEFLIEEAASLLGAEHMGFLGTINASCAFMKRLVDDFLDVSAIEAGRLNLDLQRTKLEDVLLSGLRVNRIQADKKGVQLQVRHDDTMPRAMIDPGKIEQALSNLVGNAVDHSRAGDTVEVSAKSDSRDWVTVSVKDEGPGMSEADQAQLFKPFASVSTKKTGGEKGTGLGLLIARKVIEAHQGQIWIESQLSRGTTMRFTLPIDGEA